MNKYRRWYLLVILLLGAGILFTSCQTPAEDPVVQPESDENEQEAGEDAEDRSGGRLNIFSSQTIGRVDPSTTEANYLQVIAKQFYAQLVRYETGSFEVVPDLAADWEVSDDGLTYRFTIRPDVQFHNGEPIQLSDIVFSLEYAQREESVWRDHYENVVAIEADEENNAVVLTLSTPDAFLLEKLSAVGGSAIYPEAVVREFGDEFGTTVENTVGSGPYKLVEKTENNQTWERFEEFYEPAYIERIRLQTIPDENTQILEFEAGNIDWIGSVLDVELANRFSEDPRFEDSYIEFLAPDAFWYGFNPNVEPFDDIRVRQALIMMMNMEQAVNVYGMGSATTTLIHPDLPGYAPDFVAYPYDPERGRELLAEAGFEDGLEVELYVWNIPGFISLSEVIQQQLIENGVDVKLQIVEFGTFISEVNRGTYPFFINLGNIGVPDTAQWLHGSFHSEGPFNVGYSNDEVDALLSEAVTELNAQRRAELSAQANELILKDAIAAPIMNRIAAMVFQPWVLREEGNDPIYPHVRFNELWLAPDKR